MKDLRTLKQQQDEMLRQLTLPVSPLTTSILPLLPVTEALPTLSGDREEEMARPVTSLAGLFWAIAVVAVLLALIGGGSLISSSMQSPPKKSAGQQQQQPRQAGPVSASQRLVRIDQTASHCLDWQGQYTTLQECATWSPSDCSTTSMTEVMNAWGTRPLRIHDTLVVESGLGVISSDQGLLSGPGGIDQTLTHFGFASQWLSGASLSNVEAYGNNGYPVIVGFDNARWQGGHWLVVLGRYVDHAGTPYVHLADSSALHMEYMQEARFLYYWAGMADVVTPRGVQATLSPTQVTGAPTVSAAFINAVLSHASSPAAGTGQALYDLGVQYGIDPAFALAFFHHESSYGTAGEARQSLSLGNLRCIDGALCRDGYAWFPSWQVGYKAWFALIRDLYVNAWGRSTVETILVKYAPPQDNNDDAAYIASVEHDIGAYRKGVIE